MAKKYKLVIECEEFWVADSLHELGSEIECTDVLDTMKDDTLQINGEHYVANVTAVRNNIRQIDEFLRETENG